MVGTIPLASAPAPGFDDPLGVLLACHRRMERQLVSLARLLRHLPEHHADQEARAAARAVLRYFDTAAPNHHADEEVSVFPRCLNAAPDLTTTVRRLRKDHAALEQGWQEMRPLLVAIAVGTSGYLPIQRTTQFCSRYRDHIALEERGVLACAAQLLSRESLAAMGEEMAARRGVPAGG